VDVKTPRAADLYSGDTAREARISRGWLVKPVVEIALMVSNFDGLLPAWSNLTGARYSQFGRQPPCNQGKATDWRAGFLFRFAYRCTLL
jgi:hypothetical protein